MRRRNRLAPPMVGKAARIDFGTRWGGSGVLAPIGSPACLPGSRKLQAAMASRGGPIWATAPDVRAPLALARTTMFYGHLQRPLVSPSQRAVGWARVAILDPTLTT